jgi:hypothetical protein
VYITSTPPANVLNKVHVSASVDGVHATGIKVWRVDVSMVVVVCTAVVCTVFSCTWCTCGVKCGPCLLCALHGGEVRHLGIAETLV